MPPEPNLTVTSIEPPRLVEPPAGAGESASVESALAVAKTSAGLGLLGHQVLAATELQQSPFPERNPSSDAPRAIARATLRSCRLPSMAPSLRHELDRPERLGEMVAPDGQRGMSSGASRDVLPRHGRLRKLADAESLATPSPPKRGRSALDTLPRFAGNLRLSRWAARDPLLASREPASHAGRPAHVTFAPVRALQGRSLAWTACLSQRRSRSRETLGPSSQSAQKRSPSLRWPSAAPERRQRQPSRKKSKARIRRPSRSASSPPRM
jgi:hypothetical protein